MKKDNKVENDSFHLYNQMYGDEEYNNKEMEAMEKDRMKY